MAIKKIKVVQIVRTPIGGIRKHFMAIINGLPTDRFESYLITNLSEKDHGFDESWNQKFLPPSNIHSFTTSQKPSLKDFKNIFLTYFALKKISPDIIHGHGAKGGLYARLLGKLLGAKVIYTAHGGSMHAMHGNIKNKIYVLIEKSLSYLTDIFIFESSYSLNNFKNKIGNLKTKMVLNYNGVDQNLSNLFQKDRTTNTIRIGAFGQLRKIKGYHTLIRAIAELYHTHKITNLELFLYGEGEEERNLISLAKDLKIDTLLTINRFKPQIYQEMANCDIVVQPSQFESFGYVACEALALGIPVIASKTGGLIEIIQDQENGLLFTVDNHLELTKKLLTVITNSIDKASLKENGLKSIKEKFSEQKMLENVVSIYQEVVR